MRAAVFKSGHALGVSAQQVFPGQDSFLTLQLLLMAQLLSCAGNRNCGAWTACSGPWVGAAKNTMHALH